MSAQPSVTESDLQQWATDNAKLALAVCETQAYAELTKEMVDGYVQPIFDSFEFICEGTMAERFDASPRKGDTEKCVGRKIKTPDDREFCWLHGRNESDEIKDKLRRYYEAVDAEHRRQGYLDLEPGHCPALRAQNLHIQAENALIDSAHELFGLDSHQLYGDNRKTYLDLLMGICIKALGEMQEKCARETGHATTEQSPIKPTQLRCANCCIDLNRKAA
jgi:hypothetical protein